MRRPSKLDLLVLFGYAAISFAFFGWRLLPHPGRGLIGYGHNPEIYVWSFSWWPHAIATLSNPLSTDALYAPTGVNLAWTLTVPGLALVFSPLTAIVGPAVSYNIAALLMPALSAWTAYLLCRQLAPSRWAAVIGGYLYGFSTFGVLQQLFGNLPVAAVFLLPLVALAVVRYLEWQMTARRLAGWLGVLLGTQLWLSPELALTVTLALALGLVLAYCLLAGLRARLRSAILPVAGAYVLGAVVAAPLLVYAFLGYRHGWSVDAGTAGTDLLNLFVPLPPVGIGGSTLAAWTTHVPLHGAGAYLGLPAIAIVCAYLLRARRVAGTRFLAAAMLVALAIALGTDLEVHGAKLFPLPWSAAAHVPVLSGVLPFRFSVFLALATAVVVALWTSTTAGRIFPRPYVLPLLAVAALVPSVWRDSAFGSFHPLQPERAAFFTDGLYKKCFDRNETVAIFPFGFAGNSLVWQAESHFWFRLASDGLQAPTRYGTQLNAFDADPLVHQLNFVDDGRPTVNSLLAFAAIHHVDRILASVSYGYPSRAQMRRIGPTSRAGGMLVAPACEAPSLAKRDLTAVVARYERAVNSNLAYCTTANFHLVPASLYPIGDLQGARRASAVKGQGLTCLDPPAGYRRRGFAPVEMGVPAHTYPYYAP